MKSKQAAILLFFMSSFFQLYAQYNFKGDLQENSNYSTAYLSLVEDYRKISGVYEDQIIKRVLIKDNAFSFSGDNLALKNRIYRIHIDNCSSGNERGHFNGQCEVSRSIVFIANNRDTILFPTTFEDQSLCKIESADEHTMALSRVDSIMELMTYDYLEYRSEANKSINNRNWFSKLQKFGESLNEPLAELYIYQFLSDRSSDFYTYYLNDLLENPYYNDLLNRLQKIYPNSAFAKQYELEITADNFRVNYDNGTRYEEGIYIIKWGHLIFGLVLLISLIIFLQRVMKGKKKKITQDSLYNELTKQEQKVLDLILENKTNKEIAQEIFVSVSTVKTHTNNLYKKLKVTSRDQVKMLYSK